MIVECTKEDWSKKRKQLMTCLCDEEHLHWEQVCSYFPLSEEFQFKEIQKSLKSGDYIVLGRLYLSTEIRERIMTFEGITCDTLRRFDAYYVPPKRSSANCRPDE